MDYVGKFIQLKEQQADIKEQLLALENIIFSKDEYRNDNRIKISKGRETIVIKEDTYDRLQSIGIDVTIPRFKELKEFDAEVRDMILSNENNYETKVSKESIRINKKG